MKDYQPRAFDLDPSMVEFLEEVARKYDLSDTGKAVRCLVTYAREHTDKLDDIFSEVRCVGC